MKSGAQRIVAVLLKNSAVQLILHTVKGLGDHDVMQRAAGVAYYAILSIFPLLLGIVSLFGFFLPSINLQSELLRFIGENLPGATDFLKQNILSIIELRSVMGVLSVVILFLSASAMFSAISLAFNRAWGIYLFHPFFIRKASELGVALSTGTLFFLSLATSAIITILRTGFNLPAENMVIIDIFSRIVAFMLVLAVFLLLYKYIPNTKTYWRYIWPGAILASVLFEIARTLFIFFLENFANYQLIYGSLALIIVLLVWIYYSAFVMILGAEFTSQYCRMRCERKEMALLKTEKIIIT